MISAFVILLDFSNATCEINLRRRPTAGILIPALPQCVNVSGKHKERHRHNKRKNMTNELLRHAVATIDYRFQKSIANSNETFGGFKIGKDTRTPTEIVNHMFDLLRKTKIFITEGRFDNIAPTRLDFNSEIERFHLELSNLDNAFSKNELDITYSKRLLQGPLSDVMCHIGQISMLSGLNGNRIQAEDYSSAIISPGNFN